jgi:biopolymer transport protein ExbB
MRMFAGHKGTRRASVAAFGLLALLAWGILTVNSPPGHAQEAPAAAAEGGPPAGEAEAPRDNLFSHFIKSLGWFFTILFGTVSITLVALIVLLAMDLRMTSAIPPGFVEEFTETVNKKRFKEAFELARSDNSFLAKVLTVGMGRLQYGIEDAREAAVNTVESLKASKEQLITYLATIGTLGPLLGLVGTVFGMILSFMELGRGGTPKPAKLAEGISHALVVTLVGIALAVPAIFTHAFFRNRLVRIAMDTSNIADDLLTQMYHSSRRPAAAATADVRTPATATAVKPAP